jgi:hypothetical protein
MELNGISAEQIKCNLKAVGLMEYLGIHIEKVKDDFGELDGKMVYYFSVPETSSICQDKLELGDTTTSDGLIEIAKAGFLAILIESYRSMFGDDTWTINQIQQNPSHYAKFYAKVRTGEVWNEELGKKRLADLTEEIKQAAAYKEV